MTVAQGPPAPYSGPMRRRHLFTTATAAAALLLLPETAAAAPVSASRLHELAAAARTDLSASRLQRLTAAMPRLLATGRATVAAAGPGEREAAQSAHARLLVVWGNVAQRTSDETAAADAALEARRLADASGDHIAAAEADRVAGVVARRRGERAATAMMTAAADDLERETGLEERAPTAAWAETVCSAAYTAAGFGALDDADTLLAAARDRVAPAEAAFTATDVAVFAMSAAMNAQEWDLVLHRADHVDPARIDNAHQRAHYWKSLALAADACGHSDRAVSALETINRAAPDFLAYRPWTADLAAGLAASRAGAASPLVRRLAA